MDLLHCLLIAAVVAIKKGNKKLHEQLNTAAIVCSVLFLLMYIAYHMTSESTTFGGEGVIKYVYYFILIITYFIVYSSNSFCVNYFC